MKIVSAKILLTVKQDDGTTSEETALDITAQAGDEISVSVARGQKTVVAEDGQESLVPGNVSAVVTLITGG